MRVTGSGRGLFFDPTESTGKAGGLYRNPMPSDLHETDAAYDAIAAVVTERLSRNQRVRRTLPGDGRVRVDRQLPFLCIYRAPTAPDAGTRELVTSEAAYLFASPHKSHEPGVLRLTQSIVETLREHFGAFLLIEIWADDDRPAELAPRDATRPGFRIVAPPDPPPALARTIGALQRALGDVSSQGWPADVSTTIVTMPAPPGRRPLSEISADAEISLVGLAVRPVYRDSHTGAIFPVVLRSLRRQLAAAIRRSVFAFTGQGVGDPHAHYQSLGPSALVKAARLVDQQLSEVSQAFDFVLQTVPLNSATSWEEFEASGFTQTPTFYYRPLPYDPALLKRRLFEIPIDRIEDVTLIELFAQKQDHLDRQLTALKNIDAPPFFYDSLQLYGKPEHALLQLAHDVLARTESHDTAPRPGKSLLSALPPSPDGHAADPMRAEDIVASARDQIDYYHQQFPGFIATVHVRNDLASSMMVAHDRLFVSASASMSRRALDPILHHEIGTHLLTYVNGRHQPFQQLFAGFAGYEELQEGLAVLAEYLVGGLSMARLRTLACRVLAVQAVVDGRPFVDAFHLLNVQHRLPARSAFMTTLRAYRGGGLTKDAIYLRGLRNLVEYLRHGHDLEPLYVGKIALAHVPLVQELRRRGIVGPPAVLPRFLDDPDAMLRLDRCRTHSLLELVEHPL
jgi:uncharacterized protein (TIGR02421 family)